MYPISCFLQDLHNCLTGNKYIFGNIIRKHSKKLDDLGDLSFPLNIKNWSNFVDKTKLQQNSGTILDYLLPEISLQTQLEAILAQSKGWIFAIAGYKILNETDVHLYLVKPPAIALAVRNVLNEGKIYGTKYKRFKTYKLCIKCDCETHTKDSISLSELRSRICQEVTANIVNNLTDENIIEERNIRITLKSNIKEDNVLMCAAVINENGVKDTKTTAAELFKKRALDLQLMAQHKYGVQVKPVQTWQIYFEKLGKASVAIEMLQNKMQKTTKICLNSLQMANKEPSFIFYNCARLSALLKEFERRVANNIYPKIPELEKIDFALLNQAEEWELIWVYVLQFPIILDSCVCDITYGIVNLQHLVSFLSNLSSIFSVYYRRIKVLTHPKEHLMPVLYARIYLLKAIQQIFHNALHLLNIEPIEKM